LEIIKNNLIEVTGIVSITKTNSAGQITKSTYKNLVTNKGLQLIGDLLIASGALPVTYLALGSSTTAPNVADTKLGTEVYRKLIAFRSRSGQIITLASYLTTEEGNGTHKELGHFGNAATITADSGDLFNHTAIDETKTDDETWTIEQTFTFANA